MHDDTGISMRFLDDFDMDLHGTLLPKGRMEPIGGGLFKLVTEDGSAPVVIIGGYIQAGEDSV